MSIEEQRAINVLAPELHRLLVRDYGADLRGTPSMELMRAWAAEALDAVEAAGWTIVPPKQMSTITTAQIQALYACRESEGMTAAEMLDTYNNVAALDTDECDQLPQTTASGLASKLGVLAALGLVVRGTFPPRQIVWSLSDEGRAVLDDALAREGDNR